MGIWHPPLGPVAHERVLWSAAADLERRRLRRIGGRLYITDQRVAFRPNRLDAALGGRSEDWSHAEINDVRALARSWLKEPRALKPGVHITLDAGRTVRIYVRRPQDVVALLGGLDRTGDGDT